MTSAFNSLSLFNRVLYGPKTNGPLPGRSPDLAELRRKSQVRREAQEQRYLRDAKLSLLAPRF